MSFKLTDDHISEAKEVFDLFDKDRSGALDISELERLLKAFGANPTDEEVDTIRREVDKSGNGLIEFDEFLKAISIRTKKLTKEEELLQAFKIFDKNNDGVISAEELKDVLTTLGEKLTDEEADSLIKEADVDKDGKINYHEFVKMVTVE